MSQTKTPPGSKTVEHVVKVTKVQPGNYRNSVEMWSDIVERRSEEPFTNCFVADVTDPFQKDTVELASFTGKLLVVTAWEGVENYHLMTCEELS